MAFNLGKQLASLQVTIGANLKPLKKATREIERTMSGVRQSLASIGKAGTAFVTLPIIGFGAAALKAGADIEKLEKALESAMGSAEAAAGEMERLREAAKNPGLGFEQAVRGSVRLQAVGFSAEESREALLQFGNAIARAGGSASDLDGVALALTQIASKGAVSAEEINQIAERVPQVRTAMQAAFGTSSSEMIQKLGIDAKDFVRGLISELSELERAQGGLGNAFENIQQTITDSLGQIGQAINEAFDIEAVVTKLTGMMTDVVESFVGLDAATKKLIFTFAGIAAAIFPAILALSAMLTPVGLVVSALAAVGAAGALFYLKWGEIWLGAEAIVFAKVRGMLKAIQTLSLVMSRIGLLSADAAAAAVMALQDLHDAWPDSLGSRAESLATGTMDKVSASIEKMKEEGKNALTQFKALFDGIGTGADEAAKKIREFAGLAGKGPQMIGFESETVFNVNAQTGEFEKATRQVTKGLSATSDMLRQVSFDSQMAGAQGTLAMEGISTATLQANVMGAEFASTLRRGLGSVATGAVDSLSQAIGDSIAGFESFGKAVKRIMRGVLADIVAVIAKTVILKGIMAAFNLATGGIAGTVGEAVSGGPFSAKVGIVGSAAPLNVNVTGVLVGQGSELRAVIQNAEINSTRGF